MNEWVVVNWYGTRCTSYERIEDAWKAASRVNKHGGWLRVIHRDEVDDA